MASASMWTSARTCLCIIVPLFLLMIPLGSVQILLFRRYHWGSCSMGNTLVLFQCLHAASASSCCSTRRMACEPEVRMATCDGSRNGSYSRRNTTTPRAVPQCAGTVFSTTPVRSRLTLWVQQFLHRARLLSNFQGLGCLWPKESLRWAVQ